MRQRIVSFVAAVFVWSSVVIGQTVPAGGTRPNVVLIVLDDAGYGDFGSYGATDTRTPHIDSLARDGTRLTDFYAAPQCTPTRAALMTGRYQQRYRLERALQNSKYAGEQGLRPLGYSLPQLLKNNGYATGLVGKWHLGYKPELGPNAHGFDYFFGFKSGYFDYYTHVAGDGVDDLYEDATPVRVPGYMTDLITERAVRFIDERARRPFFLEVSYNAPHWPYQPPDRPSVARENARHLHSYDEAAGTRQDYVAMLERVDHGVGQILQTLERLALAANTLVIVTNDNGGEWLANNAPLFHRKDTLWEGGIRVPVWFRWPGRIPAGQISPQVGIVQDLTASILAATATSVPDSARPEGINLLPMLEGRSPAVERTLFWRIATANRQQRAVRQGEWKLLLDGGHALVFNLARDIGERNDLAKARPDIAARLLPLLRAWEKEVDAEAALLPAPAASDAR